MEDQDDIFKQIKRVNTGGDDDEVDIKEIDSDEGNSMSKAQIKTRTVEETKTPEEDIEERKTLEEEKGDQLCQKSLSDEIRLLKQDMPEFNKVEENQNDNKTEEINAYSFANK